MNLKFYLKMKENFLLVLADLNEISQKKNENMNLS